MFLLYPILEAMLLIFLIFHTNIGDILTIRLGSGLVTALLLFQFFLVFDNMPNMEIAPVSFRKLLPNILNRKLKPSFPLPAIPLLSFLFTDLSCHPLQLSTSNDTMLSVPVAQLLRRARDGSFNAIYGADHRMMSRKVCFRSLQGSALGRPTSETPCSPFQYRSNLWDKSCFAPYHSLDGHCRSL